MQFLGRSRSYGPAWASDLADDFGKAKSGVAETVTADARATAPTPAQAPHIASPLADGARPADVLRMGDAVRLGGPTGTRYIEEVDPTVARRYQEIAARTDDVSALAKNLGISEGQVAVIKEHLFVAEHDLGFGNAATKSVTHARANFTPDPDIADLWSKGASGSLKADELVRAKRVMAHEYIEQGLMKDGLPYRSPEAWHDDPVRGFGNWASPEHFGAHDLAPNLNRNPFSHWGSVLGKSAEGLSVAPDLSNLDELLASVRQRTEQRKASE